MESPSVLNPAYKSALAIRNVRIHPFKFSGLVDVILLPETGTHKIALVECKVFNARDAGDKSVGQLLKYLTFGLKLGNDTLLAIRDYATNNRQVAQSIDRITPKQMMNVTLESKCVESWPNGGTLSPSEIGLYIALDGPAPPQLELITETMRDYCGLNVGIVVVEEDRLTLHNNKYGT